MWPAARLGCGERASHPNLQLQKAFASRLLFSSISALHRILLPIFKTRAVFIFEIGLVFQRIFIFVLVRLRWTLETPEANH
jgi:hypothetical protein